MKRYKVRANQPALFRMLRNMPEPIYCVVMQLIAAKGETLEDYVGQVAFNHGRLQDVEFVEINC